MPSRAPSICTKCGQVHQAGERCTVADARNRERKARADTKRPSARKRGYDAEWQRARADYLAAYPSCQRCGHPATLVDHVIPIRQAPERRLDRTNFMALCTPCHSGWKQSLERKN